jgi:PIN domain nuclease of toxin-antitoxin system
LGNRKGRLTLPVAVDEFLPEVLLARAITVLPMTAQIAKLSNDARIQHGDKADRLIVASAWAHSMSLITIDKALRKIPGLSVVY